MLLYRQDTKGKRMSSNFNKTKIEEYISSINKYIAKDEKNVNRHEANILVHANKKDYGPVTRMIYVTVIGDVGKVIIEDLYSICNICSNTFTTHDSAFSFVAGTLCIKTKDELFGEISINISQNLY